MKSIIDTANFNMKNIYITSNQAVSILQHLIKHNYSISNFSENNGLGCYSIEAKRTFTVYPESPTLKIDDLIDMFNNAIDALIKTGTVNIEIDQDLGAIDIHINTPKETK